MRSDGSLAATVVAFARAPKSPATREAARARIADTALATAVGRGTDQGRRSGNVADALYGRESTAARAYRLVAACRMTEIDDVDLLSCVTPGSFVVTTALAACWLEGVSATVDDLLDAVAAGYEVSLALGEAMRGPQRLSAGTWPSLAVGAVVAATVTTLLLGGDDEELERSAVLAAEQSYAGNARGNARENLLAGAVVAGMGAAVAARRGFAVTGSRGDGVIGGLLVDRVELGPEPRVTRPAVKGFCSARQAMGPVAALRMVLAETPLTASEIDGIEVLVPYEYAGMLSRGGTSNRRESLSNVAYQLGVTVCRPEMLEDVDRPDLHVDRELAALMAVVSVRGVADLSDLYPRRWPARLRVHARGRVHEAEALDVPGEDDHSRAAIEAKAARFLGHRPALAEHLIHAAWTATDLTDLIRLTDAIDGEPQPTEGATS